MSSTFYLQRKLLVDGKTYNEAELLATFNHVVLLAEPGGGKTRLIENLASQLLSSAVTANVFVHMGADVQNCPLVIDAFDELAKIDQTGIHRLLANVKRANPTKVIISSRSSEWDDSATNTFKELIGYVPQVARLCELTQEEQRAIFEHHVQGEDFSAFQAEVDRFDLGMLLPNPQFLQLFASAYIESERHFSDRRSIFSQAVKHLAKEENQNITRVYTTLSTDKKINLASEVFAKLLLSGAEGVGTSEATENRMYPLLASLFSENTQVHGILATRLFKPGNSADQHRPVHKIVAEYCAATHLTKQVANPANPLTLSRCLAIIAPNSTVRDELRGLLGWLAALGNRSIQQSAIELDPYAVLANGDPSQLEASSKRLLLNQLKKIEEKDPHFRRGDFWRRFSVAGFFTPDVVDEIKPLLATGNEGDLRDLILEVLAGSSAIVNLTGELRQLVLTPSENKATRLLAARCLIEVASHDHRADLAVLISEASNTSLNIAANTIKILGSETFEREYLAVYFRTCSNLYPARSDSSGHMIVGARHFITRLISYLSLETIEWLLEDLSKNLVCICNKTPYECDCRYGLSKIIGTMLDQYFELAKPPYDPQQVWRWVGNLKFLGPKSANQSKAVDVIQEDRCLRQGIINHVFGTLTKHAQIYETKLYKFDWYAHSGLRFQADDEKFLADLAYENDNPDLWAYFIPNHHYQQGEKQKPEGLRRKMREQALKKPAFMGEWVKSNKEAAKAKRKTQFLSYRHTRRMKHRRIYEEKIRAANIKYLLDNRELVECGRDWNFLVRFADFVLHSPERIKQEFGDEIIVRKALKNSFNLIAPHIPDVSGLAELRCTSKYSHAETILFAACMEVLRDRGNLESVDLRLLRALRTTIGMSYPAISMEDRDELKTEIDRIIFQDPGSAGNYLRQYVEPQLAILGCTYPEVCLLRDDEPFSHLRAALSIEWLTRFPRLALEPLKTLFEIAAQYGNRERLKEIIAKRCVEFFCCSPTPTGEEHIEERRKFWLVRAFYFLSNSPDIYRNWLHMEKNSVFLFYDCSARLNRGDHPYWPKLTSVKVEAILDVFIDEWPKVALPNHYGTDSPKEEQAYRFLTEVIWFIDSDNPDDAIPVLDRLLASARFADLHNDLKSIHAGQVRKKALRDFEAPSPQEIVNLLDRDEVVTVEGLRELVLQELKNFQKDISGGEFNSANHFYEKGEHLNEVRCTEIIAYRLNLVLKPQGISVTLEHQMKDAKRSDFTATKMIGGKRRLLVTEVKGQWHNELYTAASAQLHERYSIHPDAEQQGIFLVIWFGQEVEVTGRKRHGIETACDLKNEIETTLRPELKGLIDVFVLDVSFSNR